VACSRARTLAGLYIEGKFTPPTVQKDDPIELEMKRLSDRSVEFAVFENPKKFILQGLESTDDRNLKDADDLVCFNKRSKLNKTECTQSSFGLHSKHSADLEVLENPLVKVICTISLFKFDMDSLKPKCWLTDAVNRSLIMIKII
jgi:hypothetical protein